MTKVSFLGLGVMGFPMAAQLAKTYNVCVYNRTKAKAEKWVEQNGGQAADTPLAAAQDADFVFCCVGNDDDLREVTLGPEGAFHGLKQGAIFVDHTTASAKIAKELSVEAEKIGVGFLDAPVSGGQAGAENGALSVMVGGPEEQFNKAEPIMQAYGKMIGHMGDVGSGQLTKMVNQICIAGVQQGLSEAVYFAQKSGLDCHKAFNTISQGAAGSWQLDNRHKTMLEGEYDFGFAVDWMRKDLAIVMEQAANMGIRLPAVEKADENYSEVQEMGGSRWDTSALLARLQNQDVTK